MMLLQILNEPLVLSNYSFLENSFFYLFLLSIIWIVISTIIMMKVFKKKNTEIISAQRQQVARVDIIRAENSNSLESIRQEMLRKEEERSRQWMESEKETLQVLNGVSSLLDLSERIGRVESEKILIKLNEIQQKVENITLGVEKHKGNE